MTKDSTHLDYLQLRSPAKLNLFLHIVGRKTDGYHLLQSVFQLIDWCDTITLKRIPENEVRREIGRAHV